jgi:hypothetical protein
MKILSFFYYYLLLFVTITTKVSYLTNLNIKYSVLPIFDSFNYYRYCLIDYC